MIYIGIDPGLTGALVAIDDTSVVVAARRMPRTGGSTGPLDLAALLEWLDLLHIDGLPPCAVLEEVSIRPGEGGRSSLTSGRNHGRIEGILCALRWRYELARPQRWRKGVGLPVRGKDDPKAAAVALCRRLLPDLDLTPGKVEKPHTGLADAGLMAVYARRLMGSPR